MSAWLETMSGWTTSLKLELDKTNHVQSGLHSLNPPTTSKTGQFTDPVRFSYHLGLLTWYHTSLVNVIFFFSFFLWFIYLLFFIRYIEKVSLNTSLKANATLLNYHSPFVLIFDEQFIHQSGALSIIFKKWIAYPDEFFWNLIGCFLRLENKE